MIKPRPAIRLSSHNVVESLESRLFLDGTIYTVNSLGEAVATDGVVTLREAISAANDDVATTSDVAPGSATETDRIVFDLAALRSEAGEGQPLQIRLAGEPLRPRGKTEIVGPGKDVLTIHGGYRSAVLYSWRADLYVSGLTLTGGRSDRGGGILNEEGLLTLEDVVVTGNRGTTVSSGAGGGIRNDGGTVNLTNVTVSANSASMGGGIYCSYGVMSMQNVLVANNLGYNMAGGLYSVGTTLTITNATVTANSSASAGIGIYLNGGTLRINNSIVAQNVGSFAGSDLNGVYSGSHNLISIDPRFVRKPTPGPDGKWATVDDDLGDLRLRNDSPGLNAGDNGAFPPSLVVDIAGNPRIADGIVEIGAFESVRPTLTVVQVNNNAQQRSMVQEMRLTFSEDVLLSNAVQLTTSRGAAVPNVTVKVEPEGAQSYRLTFSGDAVLSGSLPDGLYNLTVLAAGVQDNAGNPMSMNYTYRFHRLFGDSDGDRDVDEADLAQFRRVMNRPTGYRSEFDYDGDGRVNLLDYNRLKLGMNRRVLQ